MGERWVAQEVAQLSSELRSLGTAKRATGEMKYLKSDLDFFGAGVPAVRSVAKRWKKNHPHATRDEILTLTGSCGLHHARTAQPAPGRGR